MSSLRHIETAHNSGRMIWRVKGRYKALQRRMGTLAKRVNSRIRRTTPLFSTMSCSRIRVWCRWMRSNM